MHLTCPQCQQSLPSQDATATHCRFCRAALPHGEAAARHQEMMRQYVQNAGAAPQYGAYPVTHLQGPLVIGSMSPAHASNITATVTKSIDRSMKMGLWMTLAGIGAAFVITAIVTVSMFLR